MDVEGKGEAETSPILSRLAEVRRIIARAARDADRRPEDITLVCVSKTFGIEAILPVLGAGERVFGENRVQEAKRKWPELKARFPNVELRLIGPLQSNKAKEAVELFDVIETVDRPKIAAAISQAIQQTGKRPKLLVEVNTGGEPQKAGIPPSGVTEFIRYCRADLGLEICGLMCIPPEAEIRAPHFALMVQLAKRNNLSILSMGMSADFETAIQCGATHVRIGSAIFGTRPAIAG